MRVVRTKGDKITDVALSKIGDKGLFTQELENELLDGTVDLCVQSMKDMPTELPAGLAILGVPERANPLDVLVGPEGAGLDNLAAGARVATGSLRRVAQLKRLRPDIEPCEIRGNIDTRIARVMDGEFDAAVLAASGIERLEIEGAIAQVIPASTMIPAVGQGALAVEAREDDPVARELCALIPDANTYQAVMAERDVLRALEGGCQVPMGAYGYILNKEGRDTLEMLAFVSSLDGSHFVSAYASGEPADALDVAHEIINQLLEQGAQKILEELR